MPNSKNVIRTKQPLTMTETVTEGGLIVQIPDTPQAFGDEVSNAHIAEDVVGKHTGSDEEAKAAGETAREQFNEDFAARVRKAQLGAYWSTHAAMGTKAKVDNEGNVVGIYVLLQVKDEHTGNVKPVEKYIPRELIEQFS